MMKRLLEIFKSNQQIILSGTLSGILIGTTYIPFPPWALLFCYVPLWISVVHNRESFWQSFRRGWFTQFVLSLIGFHWIAYVSAVYGYLPWPVAILTLLLFCAFIHLYIPLTSGAVQYLRNRWNLSDVTSLILLACLTSLGEIFWPSMFPWNLGYTLFWAHSPIAQVADSIGFLGLSFLILLCNAILTWALLKRNGKVILASLLAVFLFMMSLHMIGKKKEEHWSQTDRKMRVLQVQANIGNLDKLLAERGEGSQDYIADQFFSLTRSALEKSGPVDLIIWPETAYAEFLNPQWKDREIAKKFLDFSVAVQTPILTGAYSRMYADNHQQDYNALFLYGKNADYVGHYHKTNLLVFGEYTPLSKYFPWLTKMSPAGEGWARGDGPHVINFGEHRIGPQICYESLYPDFSAELAKQGANWLVNLTNDSWFGPTFEPHQHMIMTLARAIETRRPLLRSTNTGFTTAVLANGEILQQSTLYQPWTGVFEVSYLQNPEITFYTKNQSWLPWLLLLVVLTSLSLDILRQRKKT